MLLFFKKKFGSGATLVFSNEKIDDIIKIVKSLDTGLLIKKVLVKQLKMKQKNKKRDF